MGSSGLPLALLLALLPTTTHASTTPSTATSTADDEAGAKPPLGPPALRLLLAEPARAAAAALPHPPPPPPSPQPPGQTTGPTAGGGTRCDEVLDLVLVLDSSGSMAPYTYQMRGLALAIIAQFQVGRSAARIGYVDFDGGGRAHRPHAQGGPGDQRDQLVQTFAKLAHRNQQHLRPRSCVGAQRTARRGRSPLITDGVNSAEYVDAAAIRSAQRLKSAGGFLFPLALEGRILLPSLIWRRCLFGGILFYGRELGRGGGMRSLCMLIKDACERSRVGPSLQRDLRGP